MIATSLKNCFVSIGKQAYLSVLKMSITAFAFFMYLNTVNRKFADVKAYDNELNFLNL